VVPVSFVACGLGSFPLAPEVPQFVHPGVAPIMLECRESKQSAKICTGREELRNPATLPVVSVLSVPAQQ
jgi:hypothetical protein